MATKSYEIELIKGKRGENDYYIMYCELDHNNKPKKLLDTLNVWQYDIKEQRKYLQTICDLMNIRANTHL